MLKKLLSGLFGGGARESRTGSTSVEGEPVEYKGYVIVSQPEDVGGSSASAAGFASRPRRAASHASSVSSAPMWSPVGKPAMP